MEKIIVENVGFIHLGTESYTLPEIQKHLDNGFFIKNLFFTPLTSSRNSVSGVSVTAHLVKQKDQKQTSLPV